MKKNKFADVPRSKLFKLPRATKAKWLEALRSGKYKQAEGTLYDPDTKGFCCLGVLEHVCMDGKVESYGWDDGNLSSEPVCFESQPTLKFWELIRARGFTTQEGQNVISQLIDANDEQIVEIDGVYYDTDSFKDIADLIERRVGSF